MTSAASTAQGQIPFRPEYFHTKENNNFSAGVSFRIIFWSRAAAAKTGLLTGGTLWGAAGVHSGEKFNNRRWAIYRALYTTARRCATLITPASAY